MTRPASFEREDILERAMDAFWRNGFEGTSLRQLEEATGLNPGSLYHHFHSKEYLFRDVLVHYIENHLLSRLAYYLNHNPPVESLRLFFTTSYRQEGVREYRCGCLMVMAILEGHRDVIFPVLRSALKRLESGFTSTLIEAGKPASCGRSLLGSYLALQLSGNLFGNRKALDAYVRSIFALLPESSPVPECIED